MKRITSTSIILLYIIVIQLQGCMSAVIFGTTAVAIQTINDPRTLGTQIDDTTLKIRISNRLDKDKQIKNKARIINTPYKGRVLLTGQAPTIDLIERAKRTTLNVNGVLEIYNEIRQDKPISLSKIYVDSWITTKIYLNLFTKIGIKIFNIKIITENREVFLIGIVTPSEGKIATNIASKMIGVIHVTKVFHYI